MKNSEEYREVIKQKKLLSVKRAKSIVSSWGKAIGRQHQQRPEDIQVFVVFE